MDGIGYPLNFTLKSHDDDDDGDQVEVPKDWKKANVTLILQKENLGNRQSALCGSPGR